MLFCQHYVDEIENEGHRHIQDWVLKAKEIQSLSCFGVSGANSSERFYVLIK